MLNRRIRTRSCCSPAIWTLLLCLLTGTPAFAGALDTAVAISLPAQSLSESLRGLAKAARLQILFDAELVAGRSAAALQGTVSPRAALEALLRGTELEAYEQAAGVVVIRRRQDPAPQPSGSSSSTRAPVVVTARESATAGQDAIGEIVVTAQRRAERLQDVPISLTVHTQAAMDVQGTRSMDDVSRLTPGVTFTRGGANNNNSESSAIAIRGISSDAGAATTGVYIDDTPIQSRHLSFPSFNAYPALFDLERVEVLRGPQGTLFGAGSEGGTVRFISPEPGLQKYSAYARSELAATAHGDPLYEVGVAGGGPIVADQVGFRASFSYRHEGGYVDRIDWLDQRTAEKRSNASKSMTARLAFKWQVGDAFAITPSVLYQRRDADDTAAWWAPQPGQPDPTNGQFANPFRNGNAIAQPSTDKFVLPALRIDWNFGAVHLVSNTSYFQRDQTAITDYTQFDRAIFLGSPYAQDAGGTGTGYWGDQQHNWTEELRIESTDSGARVNWTAGVFYQDAKETTHHRVYDPAINDFINGMFGVPPGYAGGYIYVEDPRVGIDKQLAVFGQADVRLSDAVKLTLGLRYASAEFEGSAFYPATLVTGPDDNTSAGTQKEHPVTPKLGVNYQLNADDLLYATAAKGYRIGGVNAQLGQFCGLQAPPTFNSDSLWSYEVGTKNSFADHRVLLNASVYFVDWKNIQQNVGLGCGFQYAANLGTAESKGLDVQTQVRVTDSILVGGTFSYTDAHYTRDVSQAAVGSIVHSGDHIAGSPWTLAIFGQATFPAFGNEGYVRADYQYSAQQTDVVPAQNPANDGAYMLGYPGVPVQSYTSMRGGIRWGTLDVSMFVQNLFDSRPRLTAYQDLGSPQGGTPLWYVITWRPRTIGMTATYRY
jgi:iron complex outermembrane recepter protein